MAIPSSWLLSGILSVIAVTAIEPGVAAVPDPPTSATVSTAGGSPTAGELDEVIVTAQRQSSSLERTPIAIAVLSASDLEDRGVRSEADLQAAVPGVVIRAGVQSDQLTYAIRGQTIDLYSGSQPAVYPYVNEVGISAISSSAFFDLASVQVLKGPQGTLFGRNSTGGAVLFTTTKPDDTFGGYVDVKGGNYGTAGVEGAVNLPVIPDKLLIRIAALSEYHDGYQYNLFDHSNLGALRRDNGRISMRFSPTDKFSNDLVVEYGQSDGQSMAGVITYSKAPFDPSPIIPAATLYGPTLDLAFKFPGAYAAFLAAHPNTPSIGIYGFAAEQSDRGPYLVDLNTNPRHDSNFVNLSNISTFHVTEDTEIKNIYGFGHARSDNLEDVDGTPYPVESLQANLSNHVVSDELQIIGKAFGQQLNYVAGLYYLSESDFSFSGTSILDLTPLLKPTNVNYVTENRSNAYAGYAQGTYDLSAVTGVQGLGITAGLRETSDQESIDQAPNSALYNLPAPATNHLSATTDKLSYQFGIQDQINSELMAYGVTRHSFRSGGFNGQAVLVPGTASAGGPEFLPELVTDYEVGLKWQGALFSIPSRINVAAYTEAIKNVQRTVYVTLPTGLASLTVNVPEATVKGLEFDSEIRPARWLNLGANFAYTDAYFNKNTTDIFGVTTQFGPYADAPKWSGSLRAETRFDLPDNIGKLSIEGDIYSQAHSYFGSLNDTTVPGTEAVQYTIMNFRVGIDDIAQTQVSVAAYVRNAFDRIYYVGGVASSNLLGSNIQVPGTPRTWYGEVKYKF